MHEELNYSTCSLYMYVEWDGGLKAWFKQCHKNKMYMLKQFSSH